MTGINSYASHVILACKHLMVEAGIYAGELNAEVDKDFSDSWYAFTSRVHGAIYTPTPDIGLQPPAFQDIIHNKVLDIVTAPADAPLVPVPVVETMKPEPVVESEPKVEATVETAPIKPAPAVVETKPAAVTEATVDKPPVVTPVVKEMIATEEKKEEEPTEENTAPSKPDTKATITNKPADKANTTT